MEQFIKDTRYVINEFEKDFRQINNNIVSVIKLVDKLIGRFCSLFMGKK